MKSLKIVTILLIISLYSTSIFSQDKNENSVEIKFSIDTRMGLAKGFFRKSGLSVKDKKKRLGVIEIDVASIDTDNSKRDNHLRNEDFFDVKKYPKATFEILQTKELTKNNLQGKGRLTIRGIAKEYDFQVNLTSDGKIEKYYGTIKINRKDFGITYNSSINPIQDIADVEFTVSLSMKND